MSSIDVKYKKEIVTPEDFFELYSDVARIINTIGGNEKYLSVSIRYKIGEITESTTCLDEFIKDTYGHNDFVLNGYFIWYTLIEKLKVSEKSFFLSNSSDKRYINIDAQNKVELMKLEKVFSDFFAEKKDVDNITNVYSSTVINGNNNIIATQKSNVINGNNNQCISNSEKVNFFGEKKNRFKEFICNIFTGIWSNIILILITVGVIAILVYFGLISTGG